MNKSKIAVLGSTGSIGTQTLDVIRENSKELEVYALAADTKIELLSKQIQEFSPKIVRVRNEEYASKLKLLLRGSVQSPKLLFGEDGLTEIVSDPAVDIVMAAITGYAAFHSLITAIKNGKSVALANKESLIVGGGVLRELLKQYPIKLIPVDSEHNSIFQCLKARPHEKPRRVLITASGGPFLNYTKEMLLNVTKDQAIKHPRWNMGAKISVDSATLMNKGLEVIEALELFDFPQETMEVIIHPQHFIHAMVEYHDGAMFALLYEPDMRVPIAHALFSCRLGNNEYSSPSLTSNRKMLNFNELSRLDFYPPDFDRFPCLRLAREAFKFGGNAKLILNWANEVAVQAFLNEKISFVQIPVIIEEALKAADPDQVISDLDDILKAQLDAQSLVDNIIAQFL